MNPSQPAAETNATPLRDRAIWQDVVARYQQPATRRAIWQILNTLLPYAALWYLMYRSISFSLWLTVMLAFLTGGFLVRLFIIFHDCTHHSFFKSRRANQWVGCLMGVLCFAPY